MKYGISGTMGVSGQILPINQSNENRSPVGFRNFDPENTTTSDSTHIFAQRTVVEVVMVFDWEALSVKFNGYYMYIYIYIYVCIYIYIHVYLLDLIEFNLVSFNRWYHLSTIYYLRSNYYGCPRPMIPYFRGHWTSASYLDLHRLIFDPHLLASLQKSLYHLK